MKTEAVEKRCGAVQDAHLPERQAERVRRATAGHYGGDGGTNWGAVAGAGILGALLGAAAAPQPQPQIIVVVPQPAPPLPSYAPPTSSPMWWCSASRRWYPDVFARLVNALGLTGRGPGFGNLDLVKQANSHGLSPFRVQGIA